MTKLQRLLKKCLETNNPSNYTHQDFKEAVNKYGRYCFQKALEGKLLEVRYDGKIEKVGIKE